MIPHGSATLLNGKAGATKPGVGSGERGYCSTTACGVGAGSGAELGNVENYSAACDELRDAAGKPAEILNIRAVE